MVAVVKRLTRTTVTRIFEGSIPSSHPKNSKAASFDAAFFVLSSHDLLLITIC